MAQNAILACRWPAWFNSTALLLTSWLTIAAFSLQVSPEAKIVAVAFPPWWTYRQAMIAAASANADVVRLTGLPATIVVRPDDFGGLAKLREAGAWLAVDPQAVSACFRDNIQDSQT